MALIFANGFGHYGTNITGDTAAKGSGFGTSGSWFGAISAGNGRNGQNSLRISATAQTNGGGGIGRTFSNTTTMIQFAGFKFSALPPSGQAFYILGFKNSFTFPVLVRINSNGTLTVYNQSGSYDYVTSSNTITAGTAYFFELKATSNSSTGSVTLKVNGSTWATASNVNTTSFLGTGYTEAIWGCNLINSVSTTVVADIDTVGLMDTTGTTLNNFFSDVQYMPTLFPSGAGNSTQLTPSTGANYTCVDESQFNTTDYVTGNTANNKDTYAFGDLATTPNAVNAVVINMYALKTDGNPGTIAAVTRTGGSDYDGASKTLTTTATVYQEIQDVNPGTSSAWTVSQVNGAEFGAKAVTTNARLSQIVVEVLVDATLAAALTSARPQVIWFN